LREGAGPEPADDYGRQVTQIPVGAAVRRFDLPAIAMALLALMLKVPTSSLASQLPQGPSKPERTI
ncbi:MAG: hypothetical protein RR897_23965, partial [Pseudomonas sp.]